VSKRVAALVAVRGGIGQLADPDAVEDDDDGSSGRGHALLSSEVVGQELADGRDGGG
jgi:hypothetical protein